MDMRDVSKIMHAGVEIQKVMNGGQIIWQYMTPEEELWLEIAGIIGSGRTATPSNGWTALSEILGPGYAVEQIDWQDPIATMEITKGAVMVTMRFNFNTSVSPWFVTLVD